MRVHGTPNSKVAPNSRDDGFDNNILYLLPDGITINSLLAQIIPQSFQCPEGEKEVFGVMS